MMKKTLLTILFALMLAVPAFSYDGYIVHYTKWTIEKAELDESQKFVGRFYYETEEGVFSASTIDRYWDEYKESDSNIKEAILKDLRSHVKDKPTYEEAYQELVDNPVFSSLFNAKTLSILAEEEVKAWNPEEQEKIKNFIKKVENMDF